MTTIEDVMGAGLDFCNAETATLDSTEEAFRAAIEAYAAEQVAQYKQDAERYRWLRNESIDQWSHPIVVEQQRLEHGMRYVGPLFKSSLDNKIDAAIRSRAQEE